MAKPTMTLQLEDGVANSAIGWLTLVASTDGPAVGVATASGQAIAGSRKDQARPTRTVTDGTTASNTTVTSATAAFTDDDIGRGISGGTIPANSVITAVASATSVTISAAASGTASGVTLTIGSAARLVFTGLNPTSGTSDDVIDDPTGTVWRLVVQPNSTSERNAPIFFTVPDTSGVFSITDYTTTEPGALAPVGATNAPLGGDLTGTVGAASIVPAAVGTTELAAGATTAAKLAEEIPGYIDPMTTIGAEWSQASDVDPLAFDEVGITDGWITIPSPTSGPAFPAEADEGAAHGAIYQEFGAWAADNVYVEITWSGYRPAEATPLLHVDPTTDEFGVGMWPIYDIFSAVPGNPYEQSVWWLGVIGKDNTFFGPGDIVIVNLTADEKARYSDPDHPAGPLRLGILSSGGTLSVYLEGRLLEGVTGTVPAALQGSSTHGIAIDNNQTDGTGGAGGTRPASFPAAAGPFVVAPVVPGTAPESLASRREVAAQIAERLSTAKGGTVTGPLKVEPTTPAYEPGGVQPVTAFSATVPDLGTFTVSDVDSTTSAAVTQDGHAAPSAGLGAYEASPGVLVGSVLLGDGTGTHDTLFIGLPGSSAWLASNPGTIPAVTVSGVNGATAGMRWVGSVTTGTPTTGVVDDMAYVEDTRNIIRCTVAGTPGTWVTLGSLTYQPLDSDLTAIAALTSAANKLPYATGAGTWALTDLTSQARGILGLSSYPGAALRHTVNQGIPSGVWTPLAFNTEDADTGGMHAANASSTTIASGSNGATLPQGTINVASTTGFDTSGYILINGPSAASTNMLVAYTGVTATSFTGCTLGAGTLATGQVVTQGITKVTYPAAGWYSFTGTVNWAAHATGIRGIRFMANAFFAGSTMEVGTTNTSGQHLTTPFLAEVTAALRSTTFHELQVYQNSGTTLKAVVDGLNAPSLRVAWLSPASDGV